MSSSVASLMAALVLICALPAMASTSHKYVGSFGAPGGGGAAGDFNNPQGIATDLSNGDLFVADQWNSRVQAIDPTGDVVTSWDGAATPFGFWGPGATAVDATNDRVYVTDIYNNAVYVFNRAGDYLDQLTPSTPFGSVAGVAVNTSTGNGSSGNVYVVDGANGLVHVFNDIGGYLGAGSGDSEMSSPSGIAIDSSSGDVYVVDAGNSRVERFTSTGTYVSTLAGTVSPIALAVDPSNGDVYVGENGSFGPQVARYDSAGNRLYAFGSGRIGGIGGLTTSPSSHRVYVTDSANMVVAIFTTITLATPTTGAATGVDSANATLNGTLNTENTTVSSVYFDYGLDTSYGNQAYSSDSYPPSNADAPVTVPVSGLQPNQTYHYRLAATGPDGTAYGADQTFTTDPAAPAIGATSATPIGSGSATLHAQINANNSETTYHFEYGTDDTYGTSTPAGSAGSGLGDQEVTAEIAGLQAGTIYHFRVVADNGTGGEQASADDTFTTAPAAAPTATDVTAVSATLNGTVDPQGGSSSYHFEYGTDTSYGTSTPAATQSGSGDTPVSADISGLDAGTTYHFRLVSTTDGSTVVTDDGTFTTMALADVVTGEATDITPKSATLHGTVDTHGEAGTFSFTIVGLNNPVSRSTPAQAVSSDGPVAVSAPIGDLPTDNGTYKVVLVASVGGATASGNETTFTTLKTPGFTPRSPAAVDPDYGCVNPHLDGPKRALAGGRLSLTGTGLGAGGQISFGDQPVDADTWSATKITLTVPDDALGSYTVRIDCKYASNTIKVTVVDNSFEIRSSRVRGTSRAAKVVLRVPSAGVVSVKQRYFKSVRKRATHAGKVRLTLRLNKRGRRALRKSSDRFLDVDYAVRFAPAGGRASKQFDTLTFKKRK